MLNRLSIKLQNNITIILLINDATYAYDGETNTTDDHSIRQELH